MRPFASGAFWRRVSDGPLGLVALLVICATVYVPGLFSLPPVDRDESRFAQASRQMVESGNWAVPMVQDRPRLNKPPLIYWLQSASVLIFGDKGRVNGGIWVYRVPSVLCATGAVLLTWRLGRRMFDPRAALLGAAFLAVAPIVVWDAHQARADQLLLLTVVASQACLWRVWSARRDSRTRGAAVMLWVCVALGVLAKGPITPMIAALTVLGVSLVSRRWLWILSLRPLLGLGILGLAVAPWVIAVAAQVGFEKYAGIIHDEVIARSKDAKEGHWGPPGYHLIFLAVLLWPGSLFTAAAVVRAWKRSRLSRVLRTPAARGGRPRQAELFLLAWALPAWIVFELVSTKLPHYTMPLYPALALLSARAVLSAASLGPRFVRDFGVRLGEGIWLAIGVGLTVLASSAIIIALSHPSAPAAFAWTRVVQGTLSGIAILLMIGAWRAFGRGDVWLAQRIGLAAALLTPTALIDMTLARQPTLALPSRATEAIRTIDPDGARPLAAVEYHEDSLVFLTRGKVARIDDAATFAHKHPGAIFVLPENVALPPGAEEVARVTGFNYSVGRWTTLLIARDPRPPVPPAALPTATPGSN